MSRIVAIVALLLTLWAPQTIALQAGAAKVEINSTLGTPLAGVRERAGRGARSLLDTLYVRALYLEDDKTKLCFVSADLFGITPDLYERVMELAPSEIPRKNIVLIATHTHNGPGGMEESLLGRRTSGRFMPDVLEATAQVFGEAMREAYYARTRATLGYKIGEQNVLSRNWDDPNGPIDPRLGVLRVDDSDGNAICIVGNFAATPNTLGVDRAFAFSPDFPGIFCNELENISSKDCVAMFWNGAFGDQRLGNPEGRQGQERVKSVATHLAVQVKAIYNVTTHGDGALEVFNKTFTLPPSIAPSVLPRSMVLQLVKIDSLLIAFIPGALYLETAPMLRRIASQNGYPSQLTVCAANTWLGHFPPLSAYRASEEDGREAFYGPDMAGWMVSRVEELLDGNALDDIAETSEGPVMTPMAGGSLTRFSGTSYQVGLQWGRTFEEETRQAYESGLDEIARQSTGALKRFPWKWAPPAIDKRPMALLEFGPTVRRETMAVRENIIETVLGTAHATGLPFEAAWLSQRLSSDSEAITPIVYAVDAAHSGSEGSLVAVLMPAPSGAAPIVSEIQFESSYAVAQLGKSAQWASTIAMNDAGVVAVLEDFGRPGLPAAGLVLHDALRTQASLEAIEEQFAYADSSEGVRLLLADATSIDLLTLGLDGSRTHPVSRFRSTDSEGASTIEVREFGDRLDLKMQTRGTVLLEDLQQALSESVEKYFSRNRGSKPLTFAAIIFEPAARRYHVAFSDDHGRLAPFEARTLARERK